MVFFLETDRASGSFGERTYHGSFGEVTRV
jgi:hypothetical protein